ncbi:nibrin [Oratosquilla oratoria]|uniref:nibrin n=1 Tax=Oratosquilla oratoria TaxID=337810 RepID=UPI003F774A3E
MWVLENNPKLPGVTHYLLCGEDILVSRRTGHIVIEKDASISRKHASLKISHNISNLKHPNVIPTVTLKELGAKYGTFVNSGIQENKKLPDGSEVLLNNGDEIRFGMLWNTWKITYIPMVCTTSAVDNEARKVISKTIEKLGGHLLSDWTDDCTLLVMKSITLTVKVVCALSAGCYIVTPEYLEKLVKAIEEKTEHPEPKDYEPPLEEKSLRKNLVSFAPDAQRKQLFKEIRFVFASEKQMKRMGQAVRIAGGRVESLSDSILKHLDSDHYLLIKPDSMNNLSVPKQLFSQAEGILQKKELRCIPESDIGLAILNVNKEKHCNPAFKISTLLPRGESSGSSQLTENLIIYATETQDPGFTPSVRSLPSTTVVPESGQSTTSSGGSLKKQTSLSMAPPQPPALSTTRSKLALPKSMDVDEEMTQKFSSSRKRERGSGSGNDSPKAKRKTISSNIEETQTMESQEDDDSAVDATDGDISSFRPAVASTQKNIQGADKIENANTDKQTDRKDTTSELENINRSIPFEPFTLPSLHCEFPDENVKESGTLATEDLIKQEPLSQSEEQRRKHGEGPFSMKREKETSRNQKSNDEGIDVLGRKRARENDGSDTSIGQNKVIKQECDDADLFALQDVGSRRRTSNVNKVDNSAGRKRSTNGVISNEELFNLDSSHSVRRRNRISSSASVEIAKTVNTAQPPGNTREPQTDVTEVTPIPSRKPVSVSIQSTGFISTENPDLPKTSASSALEETSMSNMAENEVENLSHQMNKSLVVIEVISLYRRDTNNTNSDSCSTSASYKNAYEGMTNFKKFKKKQHGSRASEVTLPRIIGSGDLLAHDSFNSKRDDFFERNAAVSQFLEDREVENQTSTSGFSDEALFNIGSRRRGRNRVM